MSSTVPAPARKHWAPQWALIKDVSAVRRQHQHSTVTERRVEGKAWRRDPPRKEEVQSAVTRAEMSQGNNLCWEFTQRTHCLFKLRSKLHERRKGGSSTVLCNLLNLDFNILRAHFLVRWHVNPPDEDTVEVHYITCHLADAFIQSDLQYVNQPRVQTKNNKNTESNISST